VLLSANEALWNGECWSKELKGLRLGEAREVWVHARECERDEGSRASWTAISKARGV